MTRIRRIDPEDCPSIQSLWGFDIWTLYLISEFGHSFYKVGTAWHPRRRMSNLQCGNPRKLSIAVVFIGNREDCVEIESSILDRFAFQRASGEWVQASLDEIVAAIDDEAAR